MLTRKSTVKNLKIYKTIFILLLLAVFFAAARVVTAQNQAPDTTFKSVSEIIGITAQIIFLLTFIVGIIWYVWRGRSDAQLKEQAAGWKDAAERGKLRVTELESEVSRLKESRIEDRKKYLRLRAKVTGEDEMELTDD